MDFTEEVEMGKALATQKETKQPYLTPEQQRAEQLGWIIDQLTMCAAAKGQVMSPERLRINAEDLIDIPLANLEIAFVRARKELDFVPGVSEIRKLALFDEKTVVDAEARKAWDILEEFVRKYVDADVHGNYGPEHGWYPKNHPKLAARILDTVRRTGGWRAYKLLTDEGLPFQQKRFYDEYKAWVAVETIVDVGRLLHMPEVKQLPLPAKTDSQKNTLPVSGSIKAIPPTPTTVELRDRAAKAKAAAEEWERRRKQENA